MGFDEATQGNTLRRGSTSGGAFAGFPRLPASHPVRFSTLDMSFGQITSECHRAPRLLRPILFLPSFLPQAPDAAASRASCAAVTLAPPRAAAPPAPLSRCRRALETSPFSSFHARNPNPNQARRARLARCRPRRPNQRPPGAPPYVVRRPRQRTRAGKAAARRISPSTPTTAPPALLVSGRPQPPLPSPTARTRSL